MTDFLVIVGDPDSELFQATVARARDGDRIWKSIKVDCATSVFSAWVGVRSFDSTSHISADSAIVVATGYANRVLGDEFAPISPLTPLANKLLKALATDPTDAFHALYGEFSGVILDFQKRRVLMVRDHLGTRPLFYTRFEGLTIASTDLATLVATHKSPRADIEAVRVLLQPPNAFTYPPGRTLFQGINRVQPGCFVEITPDSESTHQYWEPRKLKPIDRISFSEAVIQSRNVLQRAIAERLRNFDAIGSHISGGLDSSTVSAILAAHVKGLQKRALYFSWSPDTQDNRGDGELARIRALQRQHNMDIVFLDGSALQVPGIRSPSDELLRPSESLALEQYVAEAAGRRGIRLMLTGYGGDEALSTAHHGVAYALLKRRLWGKLIRHFGPRDGESLFSAARRLPHRLRWELLDSLMAGQDFRRISAQNFAREGSPVAVPIIWGPSEMMDIAGDLKETQIRRLTGGYLTERMESWHTNAAGHGFEYGYPLLDRGLLEFVLRLPPWFFLRHGRTRALMRSTAANYWPKNCADDDLKSDTVLWKFLENLSVTQKAPIIPNQVATEWVDLGKVSAALNCKDSSAYWASKAQLAVEALTRFPPTEECAVK